MGPVFAMPTDGISGRVPLLTADKEILKSKAVPTIW